MTTNRPLSQTSGVDLIPQILARDPQALHEATFRSNRKVVRALAAAMGTPAPTVQVTPVKVKHERSATERMATALRKRAWDYRAEQYKAGVKVTVAAANERFGVTAAAIGNEVTPNEHNADLTGFVPAEPAKASRKARSRSKASA